MIEPLNILIVAGNARSLSANRGDLIEEMKGAGHQVTAAVPSEDYLEEVEALGIDIHRFALGRAGMNPIKDIVMLIRLARLMRQLRPDVVFTYTIKPVVFGTLAARLAGVPRSYAMITGLGATFSSASSLRARVLRRLVILLYRLAIAGSTRVFFQNPDDLKEFKSLGILSNPARAVRTMGSGVNTARFPSRSLPIGTVVFLFIARMLKEKGIGEFVEAAGILRAQWPAARFIAVGPHDAHLPHSVSTEVFEQWKSDGVVEFVGEVKDVRPWLERCSVFVLPSYYREGTPRSTLEAMSTGRAVVTVDSPGCRETVVDGENGFLVAPRDPVALALAMEKFLQDPSLVVRMGAASAARIAADYDVRKVNAVIMKTMELV